MKDTIIKNTVNLLNKEDIDWQQGHNVHSISIDEIVDNFNYIIKGFITASVSITERSYDYPGDTDVRNAVFEGEIVLLDQDGEEIYFDEHIIKL